MINCTVFNKMLKTVQLSMKFTDACFIIAQRLLSEPEKSWTTLDFPSRHRPRVVRFFNYLIEEKVLFRKNPRGRNSFSVLDKPEQLLKMCITQFSRNEERVISFTSKRPVKEIVDSLANAEVEFYLGRFTGIRKQLIHSTVSDFTLLIPERSIFYGDALAEFQMDFRILKVGFGGNITVVLPRFKRFLKRHSIKQDNLQIPSDFYTYLFLCSSENIMAFPQKEYIEEQLGGVDGNFLAWR